MDTKEPAVPRRIALPDQKVTDNPDAPNRRIVEWILYGAFRRPVLRAENEARTNGPEEACYEECRDNLSHEGRGR